MEYDFPIVVEDYDKAEEVRIWETELHDFIVWYIVPGKYIVCLINSLNEEMQFIILKVNKQVHECPF